MKSTRRLRLFLESLESRIAPASVLSFTDLDGDKVQITWTDNHGDKRTDEATVT